MVAAFGEFGRNESGTVADITTKFAGRKPRKPQPGYAQF
jgi:hypothetical protein